MKIWIVLNPLMHIIQDGDDNYKQYTKSIQVSYFIFVSSCIILTKGLVNKFSIYGALNGTRQYVLRDGSYCNDELYGYNVGIHT